MNRDKAFYPIFGGLTRESLILVCSLTTLSCLVGALRIVNLKPLSIICLLYLLSLGVCASRNQITIGMIVENVLLSVNLSLFLIFLLRELQLIESSTVSPLIFLSVIFITMTQFLQGIRKHNRESRVLNVKTVFISSLTLGTVISAIYIGTMSLPVVSVLRWLGYGYDNYGHLAQARLIFSQAQTFLTQQNSQNPLLSNTAQAGGSLLSGIHAVISDDLRIEEWLHTHFFVSLGMILGIAAFFFRFPPRRRTVTTDLVTGISLLAVLIFGHLGRVWVNGFFASNLATLAFCLFVRNNVRRQSVSVGRGALQFALISSTWPLLGMAYLLIVFWWVSPNLRKVFRKFRLYSNLHLSFESTLLSKIFRAVIVSIALLQVFLTYQTIRRSYSISHFFVDGGIEPANSWAYLACGLLLVGMVLTLQAPDRSIEKIGLAMSFLIVTVFVFTISIRQSGNVNYYATKTIVGVTSAFVCFVVVLKHERFKKEITQWKKVVFSILVVLFSILQVYQAPPLSEMTFTGPFQGRIFNSVKGAVGDEPGPMDAELVNAVMQGFCRTRPALYISRDYESELTTRWVNSVRGLWNSTSWATWIEIRELIIQDPIPDDAWTTVDSLIAQNNFSLIIDGTSLDPSFVSGLSERLPRSYQGGQICLYSRP